MNRNDIIKKELEEIGVVLKDLPVSNPYVVPQGYFESLEDDVFSSIRSDSEEITSTSEEIRHYAPILAGLQNQGTYAVHQGYFDENLSQLTQKVSKEPAKLISIRSPRFIKMLSVAAAFIGLIGITIFVTLNQSADTRVVTAQPEIKTEKQINDELAGIQTDDIIHYLNAYALPYDRTEMENYLDPHTLPEEASYFDESVLNELL